MFSSTLKAQGGKFSSAFSNTSVSNFLLPSSLKPNTNLAMTLTYLQMKKNRTGTVGVASCTHPYSYQAAKAEPRLEYTLSTGIANV